MFLALKDAIAQHVEDGQTLALEGFTHLIPFAAGHEIIRQGRRNLHLVRMTPDLIYDQMIGAGCARALTFSWGGNPGVGSLHRLRDAVEKDWPQPLEIHEHSHAGMAAAYTAGASNLPFGMLRGYIGTDLTRVNPEIQSVACPYTGMRLATVPALHPDVTILHAQKADIECLRTRVQFPPSPPKFDAQRFSVGHFFASFDASTPSLTKHLVSIFSA